MATARHFLLVLVSFQGFASSAQYKYVDGSSGNDANDGLSITTAWATIQKAFDSALPSDSVFIRGGTYAEHPVMHVSGTYDEDIVFTNYPNEQVVIDGDPSLGDRIITIEGHGFVHLVGLHVRGLITPGAIGVLIMGSENGPASQICLKDLEVSGIGWTDDPFAIPGPQDHAQPIVVIGADSSVQSLELTGLEVHHNITGYSEAINLDGHVIIFEITHCDVHDNTNSGICLSGFYGTSSPPVIDKPMFGEIRYNHCWNNLSTYATSAGIYVDGAYNISITHNRCEGNGYGIEVGCEQEGITAEIWIITNELRHNRAAGLAIGGYDESTTGYVNYSKVFHNTFFENDLDGTGTGEVNISKGNYLLFHGNAFRTTSQGVLFSREDIQPQENNTFDHNAWFTPGVDPANVSVVWGNTEIVGFESYREVTDWDANGFYADPIFTDVTADPPDLNLQFGSPCIDAGILQVDPEDESTDILGHPRLSGSAVDIGAYEFQQSIGVAEILTSIPQVFPNPCTAELRFTHVPDRSLVRVLDGTGRTMHDWSMPSNNRIDVSDLKPGHYLVGVRTPGATPVYQRFMKR